MQKVTQALIPAAGRGLRAYSKTRYLPKPLLEIDGKTLLQRNIEILRDELFIKNITVIVGYEGEQIISRFGSGSPLPRPYLCSMRTTDALTRATVLSREVVGGDAIVAAPLPAVLESAKSTFTFSGDEICGTGSRTIAWLCSSGGLEGAEAVGSGGVAAA